MNRRTVISGLTKTISAIMLSPLMACDKGASLICSDNTQLSASAVSLRKSLNYVESSSSSNKNCSNCGLFHASEAGQCGTCEIHQGAINPNGYCASWSERSDV